jgi:hypothetical protein
LIIVMGEFGRTPRFNPQGGRDHWPPCFSVLLAGGGIRGGAQRFGCSKAPCQAMVPLLAHAHLEVEWRPMGEIREVVDAELYLETAAFVTGEILHVDGGAHAGHW